MYCFSDSLDSCGKRVGLTRKTNAMVVHLYVNPGIFPTDLGLLQRQLNSAEGGMRSVSGGVSSSKRSADFSYFFLELLGLVSKFVDLNSCWLAPGVGFSWQARCLLGRTCANACIAKVSFWLCDPIQIGQRSRVFGQSFCRPKWDGGFRFALETSWRRAMRSVEQELGLGELVDVWLKNHHCASSHRDPSSQTSTPPLCPRDCRRLQPSPQHRWEFPPTC